MSYKERAIYNTSEASDSNSGYPATGTALRLRRTQGPGREQRWQAGPPTELPRPPAGGASWRCTRGRSAAQGKGSGEGVGAGGTVSPWRHRWRTGSPWRLRPPGTLRGSPGRPGPQAPGAPWTHQGRARPAPRGSTDGVPSPVRRAAARPGAPRGAAAEPGDERPARPAAAPQERRGLRLGGQGQGQGHGQGHGRGQGEGQGLGQGRGQGGRSFGSREQQGCGSV